MIFKFTLTRLLRTITIFLLTFSIQNESFSQDTVWVQTFNYHSTTRDSVISFPQGDHNQYEKILMYYSMRCKDGLISTGADRNKGCGEWDYSCNTNVIDSSRIDSLKTLHPNYIINGVKDVFFYFSTSPTFTHYSFRQSNLNLTSSSTVEFFPTTSGGNITSQELFKNLAKKEYILVRASDLAGVTAGSIAGLQFDVLEKGKLKFAKIRLAGTSENSLNSTLLKDITFQEVLNRDIDFNKTGKNDVLFHAPFNWNGGQNIIVELSYHTSTALIQSLKIQAIEKDENKVLTNAEKDNYCVFNGQSGLNISTASMSNIKDEVSISFWSNGSVESLPANTSAFHAVDESGNRQLNAHLPWSNDRVYWDSGFDAGTYDRIDKAALTPESEGLWNHWVFTKNAISGSMKIYLNGSLWHFGTGKHKKLNIKEFVIGSGDNKTNPYYGAIDDFAVWDKELSEEEIKTILYDNPSKLDQLKDNLVAFYDLNEGVGTAIADKSKYNGVGNFDEVPFWQSFRGAQVFKNFETSNISSDINLIKGIFNFSITESITLDSIENAPVKVTPFHVEGASLVQDPSVYYWETGFFPIYNEEGIKIGEKEYEAEDVLFIENLEYFNKFPARFELLSFVTPYGIGLDFGMEGKTWVFDVTDFGPILKNKKRFYMDKGGQWQEDIDIKFCYIKGRPARNVLDIQQIWPAASYGYTSILNNASLEPRDLFAGADVKNMKVRVVTTGHGQEGEFIPRLHSMNVNGGNAEFIWQVWKECADNPVYPQGGTWVYDRAGWCPGTPSDLQEFDITPYVVPGNSFNLDYGLSTASGDSRYIINSQLVKYGDSNFEYDVTLEQIKNPSIYVEFERSNPVCNGPKVVIKNNGKITITSVEIHYGIEGTTFSKFVWNGSLKAGASAEVSLPNLKIEDWYSGNRFTAYVQNPNGKLDEYSANDRKSTSFKKATHLIGDEIVVYLQTNAASNETSWILRDDQGTEVKRSKANLNPFTTYNDTIKNLSGCYQLQFLDSGEDGISWWANGDGDGAIRVRSNNGGWKFFQPDFGKELTFSFTLSKVSGVNDVVTNPSIKVYPNPTGGEITCDLEGFSGQTKLELWNQMGQKVWEDNIGIINADKHQFLIDLTQTVEGVYYLQVINQKKSETIKIMRL